ncbi:pyroglutamylated RFamide peptide receptor-like [Mizuhopecten yessoensis]|uniref:Pyroglutamylated RFamide peptide receptor n=2 Tax=Mizuhopecten yessoensis TaxID=6573 RepID=A0A210Q4J4_MIZYE|nr:pyroglutamylated RFamide peptide receptor-like [Mizuhopecten yessoensis]OWF43664.1 Pyroglutamylated RFamide peptide receptor [Mizuhopecten yessoensis]
MDNSTLPVNLSALNESLKYDYDHRYLTSPDFFLPEPLSYELKTFLIVIYSVIMTGAVIGNLLVIIVILGNKQMRTVTNVFLVSLTISDTLIAGWNMPIQLGYYVHNEWTLGEVMCKMSTYLQTVNVQASIFTLTAVAIERYYAISYPLRSRHVRTATRAGVLLVVIWIITLLLSMPSWWIQRTELRLVLQLDKIPQIRNAYVCAEKYKKQIYDVVHTFFILFLNYVIPMLIMMCAYGMIAFRLWIQKPIGDTGARPQYLARSNSQKKRIIKMLIALVIIFGVCWLPFFAVQVYHLNHDMTQEFRVGLAIVHLIGYSNSLLNPIVYGFMNGNFKKHLKAMCIKFRKQSSFRLGRNPNNINITVESVM